jgi:hypothetical protein
MNANQPDRNTAIFSGSLLRTGGQNPTVKIVWGDEDRGANASALSTWDNTITISTNQNIGAFSTTITIPNQEKIYYFRSVAVNAGGTVVSRSLGVLNPSAPVGVADLRGRWSFDDDNFSVVASPSEFSGLKLWLDASELSSAGSTWTDKSGNGNSASKTGAAVVVENDQNGLSVMNYTGNGQYHDFSAISDIRTVFWVVSQDSTVNGSGYRFLLCGATNSDFHNNANGKFWGSHANDNIEFGFTRMNGTDLSGDTNYPNNLSIISLRTNGNVSADRFGQDRGFGGRQWVGKLGELLIFNKILSDSETAKIETYLSKKWDITLASNAERYNLGAKDSSKNDHHGVLRKTFSPADLSTVNLWLDASDSTSITHSSNAVSQWNDKSGNNNHAAQAFAGDKPTYSNTAMSGKPGLNFDNDKFSIPAIDMVGKTLLAVIQPDISTTQQILSHSSINVQLRLSPSNQLQYASASPLYTNGTASTGTLANDQISFVSFTLDNTFGFSINGTFQNSGVSKGSSGSSIFNQIGTRAASSERFNGKMGEILIMGSVSSTEREKVEGYLAHKWGLAGNLPSSHPYKIAHPLSEGSPNFITDTPFGDGKAIDLIGGHVEISTGGNEEVFDGNGSFSVSAWVKGWPNEALLPIISKGGVVPDPRKVPSMKLWLDAKDLSTMDQGTSAGAIGSPTNNSNVKYWGDKSGNGHHATSSGSPKYNLNTINSSYPSVNTDVGDFTITNSQTAFDAWDSMTVIFLFEWLDTSSWEYFIQKGNNNSFVIQKMNTGANQGTGFRWGGGWGDRLNGGSKTDARSSRGSKILSFTFTGSSNSIVAHANGTQASSTSAAPSSLSSDSSSPITFGKDQRYGELFIFRNSLSDADRQTIESYIAMKWGMTSTLPSSHLFHTSGGWSMGTDELTDSLSSNIYGVGGKELASHSTALSNDNQWHHIVSTYNGGTRKIFLDGTEVSSASASGSVASTTAALLFGAEDLASSTNTISAVNHSGIKLDEVRFYSSGLTSSEVSALYNFGKGDMGNIGEFSTLPTKISGSTGTSLSTTIEAAFPNAYYEAVNLTPGLNINSATGEISGTPTVGGVGSITVIARNAAGKRAVTTIPYDSNPSGPALSFPSISPASDHAVILGEITHSGGEENELDLFWGDNDGNQTLANWDSNATPLGSGKEGFYGTTISGLTAGETYYYRLRSQGKLNPKGVSGANLKLWLDASELSTVDANWQDKSGNGNHATTGGSPSVITNAQNGLSVMHYTGNGQRHKFNMITDIRTVFWVISQDSSVFGSNQFRYLLSDSTKHPHFHNARNDKFWSTNGWTHANIKSGQTKMNGAVINGQTTSVPSNLSVVSLRTTGNVHADNFGYDRGTTSRQWIGKLAELIVYNSALSDSDIAKVEGYLAHKWGLTSSLHSAHTYKSVLPTSQVTWSSVQTFTTPTNVTVPVLGSLSTANLTTTTADLESTLSDNGNAATNLVFYWGDNDGGTNPSSWDSNFTVSNAQEGTLRKSLTGLTGGTTYYFRTFASNWKGNVWASTTRSFTTVTSTVRDNPVRNSDLKGWWKLDGNLKDSSGNGNHGDAVFIWKPTELDGMKLWLDASSLSTAASTWEDISGNGNSATKGGTPSVVTNAQNGLSVMHYTGNGQRHKFNMISDIRTVFWVISQDSSAFASPQFRHLLADSTKHPHFHNASNNKFWSTNGWTHANIKSGQTKMNGSIINGQTTNVPSSLSVVSLRTIGNVEADNFGYDRTHTSWQWRGKLGELMIFNTALSDEDIDRVEGQLAHKWGLTASLPNGHPYKLAIPILGSNPFSTDAASISGQSLNLSNGSFATVSTGGTEDVFDGDSNFSVSMWVKGWPGETGQSLLSKNDFDPGSMGNLMTWLDASEAKNLTITEGTFSPPSNGNDIARWLDKSGKGHDGIPNTSGTTQTWQSSSLNSKPTVSFSGTNSNMKIKDSETEFDGWNELHVFAVIHINSGPTWSRIFGKTTSGNGSASNTAWSFAARRGDHNPPTYLFSVTNSGDSHYRRQKGNSYTSSLKDSPGLLSISLGGGSFTTRIDGTQVDTVSVSGGIKSFNSEPIRLGQSFTMKLSEFIIFNDKLSSANEQRVEGYLAHKWALQGDLPGAHNHKSSTPDFGGWSLDRASSGVDDISLNLVGAGGEFTKSVPLNDDEWHHLATTFGSGNKKIFVDGQEVATASQTGSVTSSINRLILGDPEISVIPDRPKIDDVRFYRGVLTADEITAIYNGGAGDVGEPKFAITSPASITGAKGKSISYQISAKAAHGLSGYNSPITYSILNAPSWLSVGSTSGIVTGTPPATGSYTFDVKAQNTLGSNVQTITLSVSDYSDWQYALPITSDFSGNTPIEDWNMLVRLSETDTNGTGNRGFRYSQANSNGGDLRFIDNAGSELKYEISKWNPTGESHIWVNIPSLKSDTNITMYWGNPSAGLPTYANDGSVWQNYFGVYHLDDSSVSGKDSSPLTNNLTATNSPVSVSNGMAGTAYTTDNTSNGFIASNLSGSIKAKEGTYNIWTKTGTDALDWKDWFNLAYDNNESEVLRLSTDASTNPKAKAFFKRSPAEWQLSDTNDNAGTGNWQMLTLTINKGYASVYVDGVLDGTSKFYFPCKKTITGLSIGRGFGNNHGPNTTIDEATFAKVGRSSEWISASYQNQKPNSNYLNFGSLLGPISLNDPTGTEVYGKKDTSLSHTVSFSGSGSFSATGLPPGLSINAATGEISGSTSVVGSQNFTVTATGTTAGGSSVTVSKQYKIVISDPSSFPFSVNLTIPASQVNSTLTDFPLLVTLSSSISGFSYNAFLDSDSDGIRTGGDLRIFASNGKELSYELADWNTSGVSRVWVKVPTISSSVDTIITAVWGKPGTETTTPDYATNDSVWSNGFHGVWHMDKIISNSLSDSSPNGFHATSVNGALVGSGQIGHGVILDGTDDYVNLGREAGNPGSTIGTSFWVKSNGTRNRILSNKETTSGTTGWEIYAGSSDTKVYLKGSGSSVRSKDVVSSWASSNWHYVSAGYHADGSLSLHVDGVSKTMSNPVENVFASTRDLRLGDASDTSTEWNGAFDEVRISNVVRSADWAKAEYDNQKSSQTLVTYGSVTGPRIVTSPLTASATVNSSFTYNITASTASGAPTSYAAIDLPAGLSFTASSGAITGTPTLAGAFSIPLVVSYGNDDGNVTDLDGANDQLGALFPPVNPGDPEQVLLSLSIQALPPSVATLAATSVSATQATLEGNVISSGGDAPAITLYYGTIDGADNSANWASSLELGQLGTGTFSFPIGDLTPSTSYHYRVRAVNSAALQGVWATSSQSFSTPASTNPVVANGAVVNASGSQVTLQGRVISPGNGSIDQGTSSFSANRYDSLMLWLDANDSSTLDQGYSNGETGAPANNNKVGFWADKSGKGYHAIANRKLSSRRPTYQNTGFNSMPTIRFDGSDDVMVISGSESAFDAWDEMSVFLVFQGDNISDWRRVISKRDTSGGWIFSRGTSDRAFVYIYGTSDRDDRNSNHSGNWNNTQIFTLQYGKGTRKWYFDGVADATFNDVGTIQSSSDTPLTLAGRVDVTGNEHSEARVKFSEILIFKNRLALPDQRKVEGYLAHKWGLTGNLDSSHAYKSSPPAFNDPISAVDLTLYWGPNDGGINSAIWENNVSLGRFFAEEKVNGFSAKAYEIPSSLDKGQVANDYFADINQLLALPPSGSAIIQGDPGNPAGQECTLTVILILGILKWDSMWERTVS